MPDVLVAPSGTCQPKRQAPARIAVGECVTKEEIQQETCAGYCPSYEGIDPVSGAVNDKECLCCAPDATYEEAVELQCPSSAPGLTKAGSWTLIRIKSCKCSMCSGMSNKAAANGKKPAKPSDDSNVAKAKSKTRRR